ncbi:UPF0047 protein C4A8.02c [Leucoagaricus sp. SymC.cos]|nr:UPF0047 protein C4A8.02c [Leucoagaricus sp. SymC.cos]
MGWQKTFILSRRSKGCHLVTDEIVSHISEGLRDVQVGMLFLFMYVQPLRIVKSPELSLSQHTSAALTINENYDPGKACDMNMALDNIVPESLKWKHTDEGPDVSHTKTSLVGASLSIPITNGRMNLGTWQGIYLTEFRYAPHSRRIVATIL